MRRALPALLIANAVLTLALLGWVTWIVVEPRYWFENAYSQQGPRGERGPQGDRGPLGPPGPVGPTAEATLADSLEEATDGVADLTTRVEEIESRLYEDFQDHDLNTADDAEITLSDLCGAIGSNYLYASNSAIEELLSDLNDACP